MRLGIAGEPSLWLAIGGRDVRFHPGIVGGMESGQQIFFPVDEGSLGREEIQHTIDMKADGAQQYEEQQRCQFFDALLAEVTLEKNGGKVQEP